MPSGLTVPSRARYCAANPNLAALVAGVKKAGITVEKFAGGHGATADYAPLAALEGK